MKKFSHIQLDNIEFLLHLGWSEVERSTKQIVRIDLALNFIELPKACITDELAHTCDYDQLIQLILKETEAKHFRLIEHLAEHIYQLIKQHVSDIASIVVSVSKKPAIPQLAGKVVFTLGDVV